MGRILNSERVAYLQKVTRAVVELYPSQQANMPPDAMEASESLFLSHILHRITVFSEEIIKGYSMLYDVLCQMAADAGEHMGEKFVSLTTGKLIDIPKPADVGDIITSFTREPELDIEITGKDIVPPSLARTEWEHINRVLADCDGNISETAKRLGIYRRTLQRKLYKYPPKQ